MLLHLSSLPGPHGIGDLGPEARRFADFLAAAGQSWWQMLPVGPIGYGNSPYSAESTFAGNPLLVSPELLVEQGLLEAAAVAAPPSFPDGRVDYGAAAAWKTALLGAAFERFSARRRPRQQAGLDEFCHANRDWIDDFALYRAAKCAHGGAPWTAWEPGLRDRRGPALRAARSSLAASIERYRFEQWLFARQWTVLKRYSAARGIALIGDVPIFVAHDSADVWANRPLFKLDAAGRPRVVAGVPPDYFSETGQRWGNPLYDWDRNKAQKYRWWLRRIGITLSRFDAVRLDHFIGFQRYWEVPASAPTAIRGRWRPGPRRALFDAIRRALGGLPLIAEDLGLVTPEVRALRDELGLPGIKILQFAFGGDETAKDFLPHNWSRHCVAYTGSHDNDTTVGWFHDRGGPGSTRSAEQADREHQRALDYLCGGASPAAEVCDIHWAFIRGLLASVAIVTIVPMQDLLGLGTEARMNLPGSPCGNWEWRLRDGQASAALAGRLGWLTATYGRAAPGHAIARAQPAATAAATTTATVRPTAEPPTEATLGDAPPATVAAAAGQAADDPALAAGKEARAG